MCLENLRSKVFNFMVVGIEIWLSSWNFCSSSHIYCRQKVWIYFEGFNKCFWNASRSSKTFSVHHKHSFVCTNWWSVWNLRLLILQFSVFTGGNREVAPFESVTLDGASLSYDPDNPSKSSKHLLFSWECSTQSTDGVLFFAKDVNF